MTVTGMDVNITIVMALLRPAFRFVWNLIVPSAPASSEPYGSHVPVLAVLAMYLRPRRVLELGCGLYSTPMFLDSACWPSLEHLTSIETDDQWFQRVVSVVGRDPRWRPHIVESGGSVAQWLRSGRNDLNVGRYDLIFVDDSANDVERRRTLSALFSAHPRCPIVVHDVEKARLRSCVWARGPYIIFDAFSPQTGLCNLSAGAELSKLKRANAVLRTLRNQALTASSLREWVAVGRAAIGQLEVGCTRCRAQTSMM